MIGSQWAVYELTTLPNGFLNFFPADHATTIPSGGVGVQIPDATSPSPTYVNFLLDTFTTSLTESSTITAVIEVVTTSSGTAFVGNPDGGCPGVSTLCPGAVRLFIQANLPHDGSAFCVGENANINDFWWSNNGVAATTGTSGGFFQFTAGPSGGTITLSVPLDPSKWSGICGNFASLDPFAFDAALADIKYVGLSFGSGFFFAKGVGVNGATGTATFQLISYNISG